MKQIVRSATNVFVVIPLVLVNGNMITRSRYHDNSILRSDTNWIKMLFFQVTNQMVVGYHASFIHNDQIYFTTKKKYITVYYFQKNYLLQYIILV